MVTKRELIDAQTAIAAREADIKKALPKTMASDKFIATVQTALAMSPGIVEASSTSILQACMKAAADGLMIDGREAALVIYRSRHGPRAQYMPMVNGIIKKVRQSGDVSMLASFPVFENDEFDIQYGMSPNLVHVPNIRGERGEMIGVYAICKFKDGTTDVEWMSVADVEKIRARSRAKNDGPWKTDYDEMARKTVIRRIAKRLPMSTDAMSVVTAVDDLYDLTTPVDVDGSGATRKTRGAGASMLNDGDGDGGDGDDNIIDVEADEVVEDEDHKPATKKKAAAKKTETAKQKKAREAKEAAAKATAEAEAAAAEAEEDEAGDDDDGEAEAAEDVI